MTHHTHHSRHARPSHHANALLPHLVVLIEQLSHFEHPADQVLSHYFRAHSSLGRRDRGQLAQAAFHWLRHLSRLEALCAHGPANPLTRMAWLAWYESSLLASTTPNEITKTAAAQTALASLEPAAQAWLSQTPPAAAQRDLPPELRYSLPSWLWQTLLAQYGEPAHALAQAWLQSAPLTLRVNALKSDVASVTAALHEEGIEVTPASLAPLALHVHGHPALERGEAFRQGWFEVQDEGSQLLALACGAKRGQMVLDLCAGAGGKTLALAAAMHNRGRLYAFDVSAARLERLKLRARRAGVDNLYQTAIRGVHDERVKRLAGKLDRVLIDAPCSGSGTLRRNPDLKWRQDEASLARLMQTQAELLQAAARLPKPQGWLIYATCSVLAQENQEQVARFLHEHPNFELLPECPTPALASIYREGMALLLPSVAPLVSSPTASVSNASHPSQTTVATTASSYRGDGFFVAVFRRRS